MISAVIPTFNRSALLERAIRSIDGADEIIVVDNGSTEPVPGGDRTIRLHRNHGFAFAVNRGVEAARGEWIAILNNDVVLEPGYLARLRASGSPFATGLLLSESNPRLADGAWDLVTPGGLSYRVAHGRPASQFHQPRPIQFAPFTAVLIARAAWEKVGPLDENYGSYLEDIDWCFRCGLSGIQGWFEPAARGVHRGSATLGAWREETVRLLSRNQILFISKYYRAADVWRYACPALIGQLLWGLAAARKGQARAWWTGKRDGWRLWRHRRLAVESPVAVFEESVQELRREAADWFWKLNAWIS